MNTTTRALLVHPLLFVVALACSSSETVVRDAAIGTGGSGGSGGSTVTDGGGGTSPADGPGGAAGSSDGPAGDGATTSDGGAGDGGTTCGATSPTCAPALGAQIDRLGRPAVNTALTDPFWNDGTQTLEEHHAKQDKYNEASNPATWGSVELAPGKTVTAAIKGSLAAYDALDGTSDGTMANDGCGNQLAFGATYKGTAYPDYTLLTTVLTDDRLYLNTASGTCSTYLAVEANELGVTNTDCGGRTPSYNTVDITYSALVTGHAVCTTMCDVSNGVVSDPDKGAGLSETTFPFLGAPVP
jgi:hypothetical protein